MVDLQRKYAVEGSIVMDGRDIGTVVFPNADVKVFLSASLAERAMRRWNELAGGSNAPSLEEIKKQLAERDEMDSSRAISPLRKAADAVELDTTNMTIEDQVDAVIELIQGKETE
jgi:cytidylate kinase